MWKKDTVPAFMQLTVLQQRQKKAAIQYEKC